MTHDPGKKMVWKTTPWIGGCFMEGGMLMYAVVEVGGKQYKVSEGDIFKTERFRDVKEGDNVVLDRVLAVKGDDNAKIGSPYVEGAKVTATLVNNGRYRKVITVKFKGRKGYRRTKNHRQWYSMLKVEKIEG